MNPVQGSHREHIAPEDLAALREAGVLVADARRERPRWFDGRFLAARDLIREQQYFLTREADLGQAAGSGVATGLWVGEGTDASSLVIGSGHGITPSGELVLLERELTTRLTDIPRSEQLSAQFGLGRIPQPPMRSRTGLFVLALRPVEFTANPVGAYPNSINGQRTVQDGDVIEATALVLVPWQDDGAADALEARRGRAARAIFVEGSERGISANVLPIAMLALDSNAIVWIDVPMVRRELGADRGDLPGLGFAPRGLHLAHVLQHQSHLADVVALNRGRSFAAAAVFSALPPAGPLPPGVINPADFTQGYFPAEVTVDFSVIPEDELPALVEDALTLPALDLTASADALETTAVLVLAAIPRSDWRTVVSRLSTPASGGMPVVTRALTPAAANLVAARKPLEILQRLRIPRPLLPPLNPADPVDAEWQRLAGLSLWYIRRRNLAYRADLTGVALRFAGAERVLDERLLERLNTLGLRDRLSGVLERATPAARLEVTNLLDSPRFADSPALTAAAVGEFSRTETLDQAAALRTAASLTGKGTGAGLSRLETVGGLAGNNTALQNLAANADWQALDRTARLARADEVPQLAETLGRVTRPTRPGRTGGTT